MPLGLLEFCLKYCRQSHNVGGVFEVVGKRFADLSDGALLDEVASIYEFRNKHVAHVNVELTDLDLAATGLQQWIDGLTALHWALATKSPLTPQK